MADLFFFKIKSLQSQNVSLNNISAEIKGQFDQVYSKSYYKKISIYHYTNKTKYTL
jgi:intein-encoded DNA endonuclease-like protein